VPQRRPIGTKIGNAGAGADR